METDPQFPARPIAPDYSFPAAGSPWYMAGEDALRLDAFNTAAGVTLTCAGRFRRLDGQTSPFVFTLTPNTVGTLSSSGVQPQGEGWLLDAIVFVSAGTPTSGQCVVLLRLVRGVATPTVLATIAQGSVTPTQDVTWPPTIPAVGMSSLASGSVILSVAITQPAAGAEFTQTVTAGKRWRVQSVRGRFTTSASAGSRSPALIFDDGANEVGGAFTGESLAASQQSAYTWAPGLSLQTTSNSVTRSTHGITNAILGPGFRIRSLTQGILAGDQWDVIRALVEEWNN